MEKTMSSWKVWKSPQLDRRALIQYVDNPDAGRGSRVLLHPSSPQHPAMTPHWPQHCRTEHPGWTELL